MLFRIRIVLLLLFTSSLATAHGATHYKNAMWFNGTGFEKGDFYSMEGVLYKQYSGALSQVIDLEGRFVVPPLGDAHNHGLGSGEKLEDQIQSFLSQGIFYVMNPNNVPAFTIPVKGRLNKPETPDVIWSNGGLTGSGGHPMQIYAQIAAQNPTSWPSEIVNQAYHTIDSLQELQQKWPRILADQPDFIKVYLEYSEEYDRRKSDPAYFGKRGIDPRILPDLVQFAHGSGLRVVAHVNTAADFRNAVQGGVDIIGHLPLERITSEDAKLAAKNHTAVITTTLSHRPTDSVKNPSAVYRDNLATLYNNGVTIALGTDSHRSVLEEAQNILSLQVIDSRAVLNLATQTTAEIIFPNRKIGQLADGYEANFIVVDANPLEDFAVFRKPVLLVKKGHVLRVKTPVAAVLMQELHRKGIDAAVELYRNLQSTKSEDYDFSELQLNRLGYDLLQKGKVQQAITIFQLNVEFFPNSSNVYDSLGEAYLANGEKENARKNYQKSLELNPHNTNAAEILKKLN